MQQTNIVVTDYIEPDLDWEAARLADADVAFRTCQLKYASPSELVKAIGDAEVVIVNMAKLTGEVLRNLPACKLVIRHGVGYDNVDLDAATECGIQVCNVPDYCREEVAEQAMMLMLLTRRRFTQQLESMDDSIRKGQWDFSKVVPVHRMSSTRAGIIGCGRIGSLVLRMLRGFGIDVMVHDPYLGPEPQAELGVRSVPLEELLPHVDLLSIHSVLTPETRHMIGERELRMMKPSAVLVNTARGAIVNVLALEKACREGWIAGAGIDVFEKEPPDARSVPQDIPNLIRTPHLAWYSEEAGWSIREKILEDILRYREGRAPRFPVNTVPKASHGHR
jgi:D-3-phosphoglycerate dehydrogenase